MDVRLWNADKWNELAVAGQEVQHLAPRMERKMILPVRDDRTLTRPAD